MFVYADQTFLGVLEPNSYTFAYVEPGHRLLWLNWAKITDQIEIEPGTVRYFWVYDQFSELDEVEGHAEKKRWVNHATTRDSSTSFDRRS